MPKRWISVGIAVTVILLVAGAIAATLVLRQSDGTDSAQQTDNMSQGSSEPPPGVPAFDVQRAQSMESALASGDGAELATAIALPNGEVLSPDVAAEFAALGPIQFDLDTVAYHSDSVATVDARTGDDSPSTWTVYLVLVDSQWRVSTTGEGQ